MPRGDASRLKPAKKGEVRNPLGAGHPNYKRSKERLQKALLQLINTKNPITGEEELMQFIDLIDAAMIRKASKGDVRAYEALLNRAEGRVVAEHEELETNKQAIIIQVNQPTHDSNGNPL